MNRRELLKAVAGTVAVAGVEAEASTVDATSHPPVLAIFECRHHVSQANVAYINEMWRKVVAGTPFEACRAIVIDSDLTLTLVDANGRVLNRRLDDDDGEGGSKV